ncbi:MAG: PLDc N-terminal domain-containing protein [Phycisphaerales bacterium]
MPINVYGLLGLLHLVLWIIAAVEIVRSSRPLLEKVLWLLVILLLPLVGLIIYFVMGRK